MNEALAEEYLADAIASFRSYKKLADKAIAQVTDEELFVTLDEESNSIAVVMKHMAGNMISRWTDFLTTDGEETGSQSRHGICDRIEHNKRRCDFVLGAGLEVCV